MGNENSCAEQQSCLYLCQISVNSEFLQNMLQSKQNFGVWMYFQISLSLWELQGIKDMLSLLR